MQQFEIDTAYEKKTPSSKRLFDRGTTLFAGGINHNIRYFKPYPFFTERANGKFIYDVDSNKYIDYWMGHWALILGHSAKPLVSALSDQIRKGTLYGTANSNSVELAGLIQKLMPRAELIRFCSTGSEATMYAVRLARAKSRKRVVAKVIGGWHGFNSTLMHSVNYPFHSPEGAGLIAEEGQFVESLPFNDLDSSLEILESVINDLACILLEPILAGAGCITPDVAYLRGLHEFAKRNNILLIFDEIVTGFRLSIGGAAQKYGIEPDIFTLGKIVGGGLPIGVVCGKKDVMTLADPTSNTDNQIRCNIGGGTFSCNPMTMAAGLSTIKYLDENSQRVYSKIDRLGTKVRSGLKKIFRESKIEADVTGEGSLFLTHFLNDKVRTIKNATDAALSNQHSLHRYHLALMTLYQIFFLPKKMGAISFLHTDSDIERLLIATQAIMESGIISSK